MISILPLRDRALLQKLNETEHTDCSHAYCLYDGGKVTAVVLGKDEFMEAATGKTDEKLLLAFPDNGRHADLCDDFLQCIREFNGDLGGQV